MPDVYFAAAATALVALALVTYLVKVPRGAGHHERTTQVGGGTALLGAGFVDMGQWAVAPVARFCQRWRITPNALSWASLAAGVGCGAALAGGHFGLGTLLGLFSVVGDILDGQVARLTATSSDAGELLDAAVDRYTEFAYLAGLVVFYRGALLPLVVTLFAFLACFMVSYSTAKAEALGVPPPRGMMRRHERATYLIVGSAATSAFSPWLTTHVPALPPASPQLVTLAAIALFGNASAVSRFARIAAAVRTKKTP